MILLGFGAGIAFNPVLLAAMSDVAPEESGLASGVVNTAFMMGGALGLAVLASLAASRTDTLTADGDSHLAALDRRLPPRLRRRRALRDLGRRDRRAAAAHRAPAERCARGRAGRRGAHAGRGLLADHGFGHDLARVAAGRTTRRARAGSHRRAARPPSASRDRSGRPGCRARAPSTSSSGRPGTMRPDRARAAARPTGLVAREHVAPGRPCG